MVTDGKARRARTDGEPRHCAPAGARNWLGRRRDDVDDRGERGERGTRGASTNRSMIWNTERPVCSEGEMPYAVTSTRPIPGSWSAPGGREELAAITSRLGRLEDPDLMHAVDHHRDRGSR
jgi:hypothetical protein